ncbi:MAG: sugar phosphate isomerase/epimerase [Clostridia bacterium]|nr:sugar phosphate isomerase/epimerase [Clostridia bacterium]
MFQKLGVQLFTVRNYLLDSDLTDLTFRKLADMGYTEVQTAGNVFDEKCFGELAAKNGIKIIGTHYDYKKILNNPEETMEIHRMWGTTNVGIGGMPQPARTNLDELKKFILEFNRTAEIYAKNGFKLTYHNHNFEFVRIDGYKTLMDLLYEGFDPATVSFVLDTCWVAAGGGDVNAWLEKLAGRIDILHLKDLMIKRDKDGNLKPDVTEVGNGNLDWDSILKTAQKIGVKYYVVEQDGNFPGSAFDSLKMSADFLKKYQI